MMMNPTTGLGRTSLEGGGNSTEENGADHVATSWGHPSVAGIVPLIIGWIGEWVTRPKPHGYLVLEADEPVSCAILILL